MNAPTLLIAALVAALFVTVVVIRLRRKKQGKSSCSCGCSGCAYKGSCQSAK